MYHDSPRKTIWPILTTMSRGNEESIHQTPISQDEFTATSDIHSANLMHLIGRIYCCLGMCITPDAYPVDDWPSTNHCRALHLWRPDYELGAIS